MCLGGLRSWLKDPCFCSYVAIYLLLRYYERGRERESRGSG